MFYFLISADDESDNCPHDFEGNNSDLEFGNDEATLKLGQNSFTQMQVIIKQLDFRNFSDV